MGAISIDLKNSIDQLEKLELSLEQLGEEWELPLKTIMNLNVVLEEVFSNIVFYGYEDENEHLIKINIEKTGDDLYVQITDDAKAFDPLNASEPDLDLKVEDRQIGGLGIHFVKTLMDEVSYERKDGKNVLSLVKKL
ncbi:MAG: ATP-binding protein [Bacteroidota bacterium]